MAFKKCSHCGIFTDEDEKCCPKCQQNYPFEQETTSLSKLISLVLQGELLIGNIWTKHHNMFYQELLLQRSSYFFILFSLRFF